MFAQIIKPTGVLSEFVRYYWVLEIDASEGEVWERVIPTGTIQLMFHYKKPFVCKNGNGLIVQPRSFISGISREYTDVAACGGSGVIAVVFYPFGTCNFIDLALNELENSTINLYDMDGPSVKLVEEQINIASSIPAKVNAVETYLLGRLKPVDKDAMQLIKKIIDTIFRSRGQITASDLAKSLFLSGRSLERKCSHFIGISPKQLIRISRFQEVIKSFSNPDKTLLTELSCDNGYFDQAHFIKDFKALSGCTPREFLAHYPCKTNYAQVA